MLQLQVIREDNQLRNLLMKECDILFYDQLKEVEFSQNNEVYSLSPIAFAKDGSGGEYVILEDESIGFIGSEGQVGRVAESLDNLLTFLIHAGSISDFSCRLLYQNKDLLAKFCQGFINKARQNYQSKGEKWDKVRTLLAQELGLEFQPEKLQELAFNFYQSAIRTPLFTCKYGHGENEYVCDSVLSDIVGLWVSELVGLTAEEIVAFASTKYNQM
ncbi:hypothetical protein AXE83_05005 [Streptococcus sp. oral taxon 431]|uniref:hypothetical protein n=1 Tax=Streptococcus sp. oral taxon 431 TaxID=712633 RepID=UPI000767F660|nr:hypothetical protein [Streptococcus sp. oral taxon 431]AMD96988.1 hypothetical protein AXE83_05005 [Streptococcus sp. oral taxon 431]